MNTTSLTLALVLNLSATFGQPGSVHDKLLCPGGAGMHAAQPAPAPLPAPAPEAAPSKPRQLFVSVGSTTVVQMASKRPIAQVVVEKDGIIRVQPVHNDPSRILITGLAPGITRLTLYDADGREEVHQLGKPGK